jgi:RNA polymerase sigma factor (sigma-70 family)
MGAGAVYPIENLQGLIWPRPALVSADFWDGCSQSGHSATDVSNPVRPPRDDKSLLIVAIAQDRDRECFAALFAYFAPRVKSYLLRLGMPAALADELAQETLLAVWRKAESFDPTRATASTWIFTIARNLRIDALRRDGRRNRLSDYPVEEQIAASAGDDYLTAEREEKISEALRALPEDQAEVLRLSFFEEKPHPKIAAQLGIPLGTVKSRVRLALNRLRAALEDLK